MSTIPDDAIEAVEAPGTDRFRSAATLDELHRQKKIHRDIRPENILFNAHGDVGLSDFCVSHALSGLPAKTQAALLEGVERPYGAPEAQPPNAEPVALL